VSIAVIVVLTQLVTVYCLTKMVVLSEGAHGRNC